MQNWYKIVSRSPEKLPDCVKFFEDELADSKKELSLSGFSLERIASKMPGIVENRYAQLQEVEAILEFLNIRYSADRGKAYKRYTIGYEKLLGSREVDKYIDSDDAVIASAMLVNEFALLRNKYLALHKGLENKHWQMGNIVKLRCAGLEDTML